MKSNSHSSRTIALKLTIIGPFLGVIAVAVTCHSLVTLGRAFLRTTAKLRRPHLILSSRGTDALCRCLPVMSLIFVRLTCALLHLPVRAISEVVQSSVSRVANSPTKHAGQFKYFCHTVRRIVVVRPHRSDCHPTIHTARRVENRQTAQNGPCNQRH